MAAKLILPTESIDVKQIVALVYGQPGSRKTSLCQTAERPITLAFDAGVYRAYGRKDAVLFDTWPDVASFDVAPYKTIVVDTIGMALEKLAQTIVADSPKNGNRMGGLSLQGYGVLKNHFAQWVAWIREKGQDLVFTAHEKNEKVGDAPYYCPDIVGGSYATTMNHCDVVGYAHFSNGKRVLDFAPTDQWMAKVPPCGWGQIALPDFSAAPDFLAKLLAEAKSSMGRISEDSAKIAALVEGWRARLAADPTLAELNAWIAAELPTMDRTAKPQVWKLVLDAMHKAGIPFDKETKTFKLPAQAAPAEAAAPPQETPA